MKASRLAAGLSLLGVGGLALHDLTQKKRTLLRNFPVIGHARYWLETVGPELRQYIVTGNDEERPFSRDQRAWIYASAKLENSYRGFGTDNDVEYSEGYPIVKQRTFSAVVPPSGAHAGEQAWVPSAKVMGAARGRPDGRGVRLPARLGQPSPADCDEIARLMLATEPQGGSTPVAPEPQVRSAKRRRALE